MSSAESAVALALCDGKTPDEHAQASGVSVATVRTQLRAVFEKTQMRRQAETVRLLLGMPAENGLRAFIDGPRMAPIVGEGG